MSIVRDAARTVVVEREGLVLVRHVAPGVLREGLDPLAAEVSERRRPRHRDLDRLLAVGLLARQDVAAVDLLVPRRSTRLERAEDGAGYLFDII